MQSSFIQVLSFTKITFISTLNSWSLNKDSTNNYRHYTLTGNLSPSLAYECSTARLQIEWIPFTSFHEDSKSHNEILRTIWLWHWRHTILARKLGLSIKLVKLWALKHIHDDLPFVCRLFKYAKCVYRYGGFSNLNVVALRHPYSFIKAFIFGDEAEVAQVTV